MKKWALATIALLCFVYIGYTQKPSKAFAKEFCNRVLSDLKNHDTTDFIKLWTLDDSKLTPRQKKQFTYERMKENFGGIWNFLDTALKQNLPIAEIEINKEEIDRDTTQYHYYLGTYNIKMWFNYTKYYRKGIGFHMDYINKKWMSCCWDPDQSMITSKP